MPVCINCGKELSRDATYCPSCGARGVKPRKVKLLKDWNTGAYVIPKGMKGTVIGERTHTYKAGSTAGQTDWCLVVFRDVFVLGSGPGVVRHWIPKDAVKKLALWNF